MPAESAKGLRAKGKYPVAQPPKPVLQVDVPEGEEDIEQPFWSIETLKGLGTSIAIHGALLLILAFWYFAPRIQQARVFDSRMAGSDTGVADGLSLTGGLNSELEMPQLTPELAPAPTVATLKTSVQISTPELKKDSVAKSLRSVGGGMNNRNPGAGNGDGFGLARFGSGGENIHGVEVKVGDPQFTLIWDNDVDLDLHVIEPGGKEIYWEDPKGAPGLGGELDVDNTKGFGPENIYWLRPDEGGNKAIPGPGPSGTYKWFVVYWGGFGGVPKLTHWKVRVKHDGKIELHTGRFRSLNERSKIYALTVEPGENRAKAGDALKTSAKEKD